MERQKLDLVHQPLLEQRLKNFATQISSYSFANLYLFRHVHDYEVLWLGDEPFIEGTSHDGFRFLMPTSFTGLERVAAEGSVGEGIDFLFPVAEEWLRFFSASLWQAFYKAEDSDYIFDVDQLSHYKGRHLSKKRNLVKQLLEQHEVHERPLDASQKAEAAHLLDIWHHNAAKASDAFAEGTNTKPCREAIELFDNLHLTGSLYYIGSEIAGFLIGEPLTADTYVIHFAKADIHFKGIYQYMYQSFAGSLAGRVHFLNLEQDLGRQDLRQAKHSYQPINMCKKMRLRRI